MISQFELSFLPQCGVPHAVLLPSFSSSLCLSLYPNLSSASPISYLPPSLLPYSVTLGRFLNLKLHLKSQTSSFCFLTPCAIPALPSALPHSSSVSPAISVFIPLPRIFLDIHIYTLSFSYIFSSSTSLLLSFAVHLPSSRFSCVNNPCWSNPF